VFENSSFRKVNFAANMITISKADSGKFFNITVEETI